MSPWLTTRDPSHDSDSSTHYNRDLLPSTREIAEHRLERKKKLADGKPEPKIDLRKDNSVSNILSHFKKDFNDNDKVPD